MNLLDLPAGARAQIVAFQGGATMTERMHAYGLFAGSRIRLVQAAPFHGPLLIEDLSTGARLMVGRGMAKKIEVRDEDPPHP